jgi:hypothetical protein
MNLIRLSKGKCILKGDGMFVENIRRWQMLFANVTHLVEGLSLDTLLTSKVEKSLIYLVGTQRPTYPSQNES